MSSAKLAMRQVLLQEWDPIGIEDEPAAQDEYDSYLSCLYNLLAANASEQEIADHLKQIETGYVGLNSQSTSKLMRVAASLKKISL